MTETTINDSYDFGIGRRVTKDNWQALLQVGQQTNERLLEAQGTMTVARAQHLPALGMVLPP